MMVAPNIGWSNAIPDAVGDVDFHVNGEKYSFQGVAYHDHVNLSCRFFFSSLLTIVSELGSSAIPKQRRTGALGSWPPR
jgi:hypothetical protein